jgi:membrane complex biogenesis BtpA family protein
MDNSFFETINKPVIGMVHLGALPGSVHFKEPFEAVLTRAIQEARTLADAGFDALLLQNTGDVPASEEGDEATVAFMTRAGLQIRETCRCPLGINVLMNGSKAALAIASAVEADFVRIKINVGAVTTSTGIIAADPHAVLAFRKRIGAENLILLGDLYDRTSTPLGTFPLPVLADLTVRHAAADALVISGYDVEDTLSRMELLRNRLPAAKLVAGGGVTTENLSRFMERSDAIIVGSSIKTGGAFLDPVDPQKARHFMETANRLK